MLHAAFLSDVSSREILIVDVGAKYTSMRGLLARAFYPDLYDVFPRPIKPPRNEQLSEEAEAYNQALETIRVAYENLLVAQSDAELVGL